MSLKKVQKINPKDVLNKRRSLCDTISDEMEDKGVELFKPESSLNISKEYLSLPAQITEVSSRELGEYLNAFTQQKMYMRTLVGWAELYCEEARRKYVESSDLGYKELLGTKLSETAKEREVNSRKEVLPILEEYLDHKNRLKILNLNIASIEDAIFLISREVSRRTGDFDNETRNYNVQRR